MKGLSIEEKAKRYDEALKVLHKYDGINIMFTQDLKEEMFPELREEYEDEKTRKELLAVINDLVLPDDQQSRFIDWLEKQDEHKKFRDSIQVGDKVTRNQDGMLVNLSQLKRIAKPNETKQGEQKSDKWEPQTGDTFRKKGTTSPTYHLCDKREDGITFGFVENREVGISGGEITIFALRQDYELVERPKSVEDVVEEELNRALQTKVEQKSWSEEDENMIEDTIQFIEKGWTDNGKSHLIPWLKSLKGRLQPQPKSDWDEEDEKIYQSIMDDTVQENQLNDKQTNWLEDIKYRYFPQPKQEWSREDEMFLSYIIKDLVHPWNEYIPDRIEYEIKWLKNRLKSLKPQSQWKPSDAQMASITCAVRKMKESACYDSELVSLFNDLKKLKDE